MSPWVCELWLPFLAPLGRVCYRKQAGMEEKGARVLRVFSPKWGWRKRTQEKEDSPQLFSRSRQGALPGTRHTCNPGSGWRQQRGSLVPPASILASGHLSLAPPPSIPSGHLSLGTSCLLFPSAHYTLRMTETSRASLCL